MHVSASLQVACQQHMCMAGPVAAVYGWVAASLANILVGLSMAEIASSYPVAGGPYFW